MVRPSTEEAVLFVKWLVAWPKILAYRDPGMQGNGVATRTANNDLPIASTRKQLDFSCDSLKGM